MEKEKRGGELGGGACECGECACGFKFGDGDLAFEFGDDLILSDDINGVSQNTER